MVRFDDLDLAQLQPPAFPELLDYEAIRTARLADLVVRFEAAGVTFDATSLASDPAVILQEADAYREVLVRGRLNDAVRAVLLATAEKEDLDHVVADFSLQRRVVTPADPLTGAAAVMETDGDLRRRRLLAVEALSVAGPDGAYVFQAISAHSHVGDVAVYGPEAEIEDPDGAPGSTLTGDGKVLVVVLSNQGSGVPTSQVLGAVTARLNTKDVRPLTDQVIVRPAAVNEYAVVATIQVGEGPDAETVRLAALERLQKLTTALHSVGAPTKKDLLRAAATVLGADGGPIVQGVTLTSPAADIPADPLAAPYCTGITLTVEVIDG